MSVERIVVRQVLPRQVCDPGAGEDQLPAVPRKPVRHPLHAAPSQDAKAHGPVDRPGKVLAQVGFIASFCPSLAAGALALQPLGMGSARAPTPKQSKRKKTSSHSIIYFSLCSRKGRAHRTPPICVLSKILSAFPCSNPSLLCLSSTWSGSRWAYSGNTCLWANSM